MNCRKTASIAIVLLLSVLWTLPATAQAPNPLFIGVWFGHDPSDGSAGFIGVNGEFDAILIDINATGGCSQAGGGVYMGVVDGKDAEATTGAGVPDENVLKGPMNGVCQGNKDAKNIFFFSRYHPNIDQIEFRNAFFRRVVNLDADIWVKGAREMKTVSLSGWVFLNTILNQPPVLAPPPGAGADCTSPLPPELMSFGSFPNAQLAMCFLRFLDLRDIDLTGANLSGAFLAGTMLYKAILNSANLSEAELLNTTLSNAQLVGADLTRADLTRAQMFAANLTNADLSMADLSDSIFFNDGVGADLENANLLGAVLSGANLSRANLLNANLTGADLTNVIWSMTRCPDGTLSDFSDGDGLTCLNNLTPLINIFD